MPNHAAEAIANEFLRRRADDAWPQQMLIQKLVYIAHGWNLAINDQPLVDELPQAWDNGPVFRSIWNHIRDNGYGGEHCTLIEPFDGDEISADLLKSERQVIDHVWRKYGHLRAIDLSRMTHEPGTPWAQAYLGRGRNAELDNPVIRQHFIELALAGRGQ